MSTVAIVGQYQFVVRTREFDFVPPHVHVLLGMKTGRGSSWTTANIPMSLLRDTTARSSRPSTPTRPSFGKSGSGFMRGEEQ